MFRAGDRVIIGNFYEHPFSVSSIGVNSIMETFIGKEAYIDYLTSHNGVPCAYLSVDDGMWGWATEWLRADGVTNRAAACLLTDEELERINKLNHV